MPARAGDCVYVVRDVRSVSFVPVLSLSFSLLFLQCCMLCCIMCTVESVCIGAELQFPVVFFMQIELPPKSWELNFCRASVCWFAVGNVRNYNVQGVPKILPVCKMIVLLLLYMN